MVPVSSAYCATTGERYSIVKEQWLLGLDDSGFPPIDKTQNLPAKETNISRTHKDGATFGELCAAIVPLRVLQLVVGSHPDRKEVCLFAPLLMQAGSQRLAVRHREQTGFLHPTSSRCLQSLPPANLHHSPRQTIDGCLAGVPHPQTVQRGHRPTRCMVKGYVGGLKDLTGVGMRFSDSSSW